MLQRATGTMAFIEPCLPSPAKTPPAGPNWLHEIEHDGFRILARRDATAMQAYSRNGHTFGHRFPLIVAAVIALPARSCLLDGEAIVSDASGLAVFDLLRSWRHDHAAVLCAFDLLELDGEDLRRAPIEQRKQALATLVGAPRPGIAINKHFVGDGGIVYRQACRLGCEGIVSKRLGSAYRSGRSKHWVKVKNPAAPALCYPFSQSDEMGRMICCRPV